MTIRWLKREDFVKSLLKKRIIYLDQISKQTAEEIGKQIIYLNSLNKKEIQLYLDCAGGDVVSGLDLYDIINYSQAPIQGIIYRQAYSMAAVVLQACHRRFALANSEIRVHQTSINVSLAEIEGKQKIDLSDYQRRQNIIFQIFVQKTKLNLNQIKKYFNQAKRFLPEEALKLGLIDQII